MQTVFTVNRRFPSSSTSSSSFSLAEFASDDQPIASISGRNIAAFTSSTDLEVSDCKVQLTHVFVTDLNVPHEIHKVKSHTDQITCLQWDSSCCRLLIGDASGNIEIWSMNDHLLSDWSEVASYSVFAGEKVLSAVWFHTGFKLVASPVKRENNSLSYSEKFSTVPFGPSVAQFAGKPADGLLAISCSGLVWSLVQLSDGSSVTGSGTLFQVRNQIRAVDISYARNGHFLVVCSNGCVDSSISCFTVRVQVSTASSPDRHTCTIQCLPFSSFYLNASVSNAPIETYSEISHLKFVLREGAEAVVVATSGAAGSTMELWELKEKPIILHSHFSSQKSASEEKEPGTVAVWQHRASSTHTSEVVCIATPRHSILDMTPPASYVVVAYRDTSLRCLLRDGLKEVDRISLFQTQSSGKVNEDKNRFRNPHLTSLVSDMQFTWNGCALLMLNSYSEITVFRLNPVMDPTSSQPNMNYTQMMLEYCLLTGYDCWDVVVSFRGSKEIESLFEQVNSSFQSQSAAVQQRLLMRLHELKGILYRSLPARSSHSVGQVKAGDAYATILLTAVYTFLKSLLRARENQEKEGPAESVYSLIQTKGKDFLNVDKVVVELEHKEFLVEASILQSIQNLNQWIADLALYLLASLPYQIHDKFRFPGGCLVHDTKALNMLRELLVIMRIWGLINENCLPLFTTLNGELDVIAHLFKLLTVRVCGLRSEPDESLLEECYRLTNQVMVNQPELTLKSRGILNPSFSLPNHLPITLTYLTDSPALNVMLKTHVIEGAVMYNLDRRMDVIRNMSLGHKHLESKFAPPIRKCTRCQAVSLLNNNMTSRFPSARAWDQRFARRCICSGSWA